MRLSARPIVRFSSVNSYAIGSQWTVRAGDSSTLFFQIIDLDEGPIGIIPGIPNYSLPASYNPGLRYLVGIGATAYGIDVTFPSINPALSLTLTATRVNPNDNSVWSVAIPSAAQPGGGNVQFSVTEDASIKSFSVMNMLAVEFPSSNGSC